MADDIENAGYEKFRQLINSSESTPDQWDYLAILDDEGDEITRIQISEDDRFEWGTSSTSETQTVEGVIRATDSDIDVPVTVSGTALYDTDSGGDQLASDNSMPDATLSVEDDDEKVKITHSVTGPV